MSLAPAEKKSLHANERDTEANHQRREAFVERLRLIDPERLIDLEESGVSPQMTKRYGRARRGQRIAEATPEGNWKTLTILGAMSLRGMIATMTIEAATNAEIFLAFLDPVLCPALRPGDVVVMDNLSSHKVTGVRERIEQAGTELLYLPPYSPDLNPIEKGLGQTQTTTPRRQGKNRNRARSSDRRAARHNPHSRRNRLVQAPTSPYTLIANQPWGPYVLCT